MERYYKMDIRRLPWGLVWSWGTPASFLAFAVRKVLPFPFYGPNLVPEVLSLNPVSEDAADSDLRRMMQPPLEQLAGRGFTTVFLYTVPTLGPSRGLGRALLAKGGETMCLIVSAVTGTSAQMSVHLVSAEAAGGLLSTSSAVLRLPPVPGVDVLRLPGADVQTLVTSHFSRLTDRHVRVFTAEAIVPLIKEQQQRMVRHYIAQGLFVEATPEDIERVRGV